MGTQRFFKFTLYKTIFLFEFSLKKPLNEVQYGFWQEARGSAPMYHREEAELPRVKGSLLFRRIV